MALKNVKDQRLLYHMTDINNLGSIIMHGLRSRRNMLSFGQTFADVANPNILTKREQLGIDDYIPFHFHPYSSFDYIVQASNPDIDFIYLCITREWAKENGFRIIPSHPLNFQPGMLTVYDYDKGFEVIDWDSMAIEGNSDPYVKQVKMAECLTDQTISIDDISYIYVSCEEAEQYVHKMLNSFNVNSRRHINIQPIWFNRGVF